MKMRNRALLSGFLVSCVFYSPGAFAGEEACTPVPGDWDIIRGHVENGRLGHEIEDAALTAAAYADEATSINRGKISTITRQNVEDRFTAYYGQIDMLESRFLEEPVITLLDGGCSATSQVQMLVRYAFNNAEGKRMTAAYEFAWFALWQKGKNGTWQRTVMVSTDDGGTFGDVTED